MSLYASTSHDTCACGGSCGCSQEHSEVVELSRESYTVRLEEYLRDLKAEIAAVERELAALRQAA